MKKILFITNTFGKTGSEMLLLYLMKSLDKGNFRASLFCKHMGALLEELPSEINSYVSYRHSKRPFRRLLKRLLCLFRIDPIFYQLKRIQAETKADLWYVNTIVNPYVYQLAKKLGIRVITHVHELPGAYDAISDDEMAMVISHSELCIGCAEIVCEKLTEMGHKNVKLLYGAIDPERISTSLKKAEARDRIGLKESDFVWAISGQTTLTKGLGFVITLLKSMKSNAKIIWIGREAHRGINFYVRKTVKNMFPDKFIFLGEQDVLYYDYLNCADGFLLLSREDSFPLVVLEAAFLGKPMVSLNSGGVREFIDEQSGIVVDSWRISDIADAMHYVEQQYHLFDPVKIKRKTNQFLINHQIKNLEDILHDF